MLMLSNLVLLLASAVTCADTARWADADLPVKKGLVLWLDAARQAEAYQAHGLAAPATKSSIGMWFDASGGGNDVVQRQSAAQPKILASNGRGAIRFDGVDDALERMGLDLSVNEFTIFIVAAPRSNAGFFRALFALNEIGRRDYESGMTIDLGPAASPSFESLNIEGKGFGGARDLLNSALAFGEAHVVEVRGDTANISLFLDGKAEGQRPRQASSFRVNELTIGARFYSNDFQPQRIQGHFDGDVAEVLAFDRALSDADHKAVSAYLAKKHGGLTDWLKTQSSVVGKPLVRVADPPALQMLIPGFEVRELPVKISNINNVRYRTDGKLVALAYTGDVLLLSDRDGDGVEEHVETFWESGGRVRAPIGMALTPPGYAAGDGVFVASKGKCSLIVDTDGDDRADKEVVVASGWTELPHGVDALGIAVAADGTVYFGLGAADYTNAYLIDEKGAARFDLGSDRGSIQSVSPDFKTRRTLVTGIRFPVALAFNRAGDLFATDQEGATWLPNGNPFDELLHIRAGRHYGFPPRHSRFLPNVIDEPSTFDYRPQHQSACGLAFNEPLRDDGAVFGADSWRGDAIVTGYSRGKLYRTELAKLRGEYVARTELIAISTSLLVDSAIAPDGSLTVAGHGGGPDWGSGPNGMGRLFKIAAVDRSAPRPSLAWAESDREFRIAFDNVIPPEQLAELPSRLELVRGRAVAAGDRFESVRPGYAVVASQLAEPRFPIAVKSASVTGDRRTIIVMTEPVVEQSPIALTLRGWKSPPPSRGRPHEIEQQPAVDVSFDLGGVRARWTSPNGADMNAWLPHLDLEAARGFTNQSSEHRAFWEAIKSAGTLRLSTQLDLSNALRPAVQPGSRVDDKLPAERVSVVFRANVPIHVNAPAARTTTWNAALARHEAIVTVDDPKADQLIPIGVELQTNGDEPPRLDVAWTTAEDGRERMLPLARFVLPWALQESKSDSAAAIAPMYSELSGGDWKRGKEAFFSQEAMCARCHSFQNAGGKIGPDLSNLRDRDYASVFRDVVQPGFSINPDFITYNVALKDGRVLTGTIRTAGSDLRVGDSKGEETVIASADVEEMKPSPNSTMPEGLDRVLGPARLKDLLTFLLTAEPADGGAGTKK